MNKTLWNYIENTISEIPFQRSLLQNSPRTLFDKLPKKSAFKKHDLDNSLIIHVRGGDALFSGSLILPPIDYYISCIDKVSPSKVVVVSEPDNLKKYKSSNPVPLVINQYCEKKNIKFTSISSEDILYDAGLLFRAKRIVTSTSSFSKTISLYSRDCENIFMPRFVKNDKDYFSDKSVQHVSFINEVDLESWANNLDYRLRWVSG